MSQYLASVELLARDSDGLSRWDVLSLIPHVPSGEKPPTLVSGVTLDEAIQVFHDVSAIEGPSALVLWPSWAIWPLEWAEDNERLYMDIVVNIQCKQVALPAPDANNTQSEVNPLEALGRMVEYVADEICRQCDDASNETQKSGIVSETVNAETQL